MQIQPTHRRRWIRRTRTVIERREVRVVSIGWTLQGWCRRCSAAVPFVSLEVAAQVADQPVTALVEQIVAGEIHVADRVTEGRTVCLASVVALVESH